MDCITKTVFPDGRIRVSDGVQARELRLDELLDPGNPWGLRAQVYEFQATEERAFHDEATDTNGLYANPIWWELIASKEELEACPDIYWFGEKVITFVNGEMAILPLLARVGDLYSGTQADGILEAVGVIAEAVRRTGAVHGDDETDEEIARKLGVTEKLLVQGELYCRQLANQDETLLGKLDGVIAEHDVLGDD
ncbi:hypothetical protein [Adlercreutzia caecimuris]|uniref:hypothetical protein n=1 Tax=Adlercreutzia caecimuris TaxID=671266 RepID=UPI001C3EA682|nr:hypothetical protein [Adlercreutzia caecimuris]